MLVVGLAHVEHADVPAVDELVHGFIALHVDVDAREAYHRFQGGVLEAEVVVVAAVSYLQGAVAQVGLVGKEAVVQVLRAILLVAFQLEGVGFPGAAPSAAHLQVHIAVHGLSVLRQEGEVHGPFPVHVPVALGVLSVTGFAAASPHHHAYLVAVEEVGVAHHREDGSGVVFVSFYVAACGHLARQRSLLVEPEAHHGMVVYVEVAR